MFRLDAEEPEERIRRRDPDCPYVQPDLPPIPLAPRRCIPTLITSQPQSTSGQSEEVFGMRDDVTTIHGRPRRAGFGETVETTRRREETILTISASAHTIIAPYIDLPSHAVMHSRLIPPRRRAAEGVVRFSPTVSRRQKSASS